MSRPSDPQTTEVGRANESEARSLKLSNWSKEGSYSPNKNYYGTFSIFPMNFLQNYGFKLNC
eukprot:1146025-Amphidinium_carterae.1